MAGIETANDRSWASTTDFLIDCSHLSIALGGSVQIL